MLAAGVVLVGTVGVVVAAGSALVLGGMVTDATGEAFAERTARPVAATLASSSGDGAVTFTFGGGDEMRVVYRGGDEAGAGVPHRLSTSR